MQKQTVLVIAHRLSTVRKADKIMVIENGELIEEGSHEDLMDPLVTSLGAYRNMVNGSNVFS